jgi:small-conductance mechanosensitive channel
MSITINKKRLKRILVLTGILLLSQVFYWGIENGVIPDDSMVMKIIELFLTFVISLLVINIILRLTEKRLWTMFEKEMEVEQRIIVSRLYSITLYTIAIFVTIYKAGVSIGNLTIFIGLVASGFAFAIRDILLSFFAWFIILNRKPFKMGDYIEIDSQFGLVTRIGTFYFTLELNNKKDYVKIPNSMVLSKHITIRGESKYREELKIALRTIPSDIDDLTRELQIYTRSRVTLKDQVKVTLIAENNGWFILISYSSSFEHDTLKPAIFAEILRIFNEHLKISS